MVSIGLLQEYTKEDFSVIYTEKYFTANSIKGLEKKRPIFLNICRHDIYCLAHDLFLRVPEEVSISKILQVP